MKIDPANLDFRESHHLMAGALIPRPIVLVSTVSEKGIFNVAPFATITRPSMKPALMGFEISTRRDGRKKDTIRNIEFSKDFVVSIVTESMAEAMNKASAEYPSDVSEFTETGLTPIPGDKVKAPLVAESPVNFECQLLQIMQFGELPRISQFVIGEVMMAHIRDDVWIDDNIDSRKLKAIGRLGTDLYCRTTDIFEMKRENIL
jgi:flavin reductase (DIM6/NTAB) family NADH-FMN oxidoreductase RutF